MGPNISFRKFVRTPVSSLDPIYSSYPFLHQGAYPLGLAMALTLLGSGIALGDHPPHRHRLTPAAPATQQSGLVAASGVADDQPSRCSDVSDAENQGLFGGPESSDDTDPSATPSAAGARSQNGPVALPQAAPSSAPMPRIDVASLLNPRRDYSQDVTHLPPVREFDFSRVRPSSLVPTGWSANTQIDSIHFDGTLGSSQNQGGSGGVLGFLGGLLRPSGASMGRATQRNPLRDTDSTNSPEASQRPDQILGSDVIPVIEAITAHYASQASNTEVDSGHLRGALGSQIAERVPMQATGAVALGRILEHLAQTANVSFEASDNRVRFALRSLLMKVAINSGELSTQTITLTQPLNASGGASVQCHRFHPMTRESVPVTASTTVEDGSHFSDQQLFQIFQQNLRQYFRNSAVRHCRVPTRVVQTAGQPPRREAADPTALAAIGDEQLNRWLQADLRGATRIERMMGLGQAPTVEVGYQIGGIHDSNLSDLYRSLFQEEVRLARQLGTRTQRIFIAPVPRATLTPNTVVYECPNVLTQGYQSLVTAWQPSQIVIASIPNSIGELTGKIQDGLDQQARSQVRALMWLREKSHFPLFPSIQNQLSVSREQRMRDMYEQYKHPNLLRSVQSRWLAIDFSGPEQERYSSDLRARLSARADQELQNRGYSDCSGVHHQECVQARERFVEPTVRAFLAEAGVQQAIRQGRVSLSVATPANRRSALSSWSVSLSQEMQSPDADLNLDSATQAKLLNIAVAPEFARTVGRQPLTFATVRSQGAPGIKRVIYLIEQNYAYVSMEADPGLRAEIARKVTQLEDAFLAREALVDLFTRHPMNSVRARRLVEAMAPEVPAFWPNPFVNFRTHRGLGFVLDPRTRDELGQEIVPTPGIVARDGGGMAISSTIGRSELLGSVAEIDVQTALSAALTANLR